MARDGRDGDGRGRWGSGVSSYAHPFCLSPPRGAPGSIRSRDVRATFLLRFHRELGANYFDERRRQFSVDRLTRRIERLGYRVHLEPVAVAAT